MFEPVTPESKLYPTDSKEMVGKEEWVAEKAIDIRCSMQLMKAALEWDGEQTGSEDVYDALALWMHAACHHGQPLKMDGRKGLLSTLQELAERYAEYVLLPAHIEKMKNGDFAG